MLFYAPDTVTGVRAILLAFCPILQKSAGLQFAESAM